MNERGVASDTNGSSSLPEDAARLPAARAPYKKPQLRRLGSVRDLTFGSPSGAIGDLMGGRQMIM